MFGLLPAALGVGSALLDTFSKKKKEKKDRQNFDKAITNRRAELDKTAESRAEAGRAQSRRKLAVIGGMARDPSGLTGGASAGSYFSPERLAAITAASQDRPAEFIPNDINELGRPTGGASYTGTLGSLLGGAAQGAAANQAYDQTDARKARLDEQDALIEKLLAVNNKPVWQ